MAGWEYESIQPNDFGMTKKNTQAAEECVFRARAEEIVAAAPDGPQGVQSPEQVLQVLHELRVHQIELEMQNDELRRVQTELEVSRERYFDLYDLAPVGYCTLSEQGVVLEANLTATNLLGVERGALVQRPLQRFIIPEDQDIFYKCRRALLASGMPQACEVRLIAKDSSFWVRFETTIAKGVEGQPVCRVVMSDITERKQTEEALRRSEENLSITLQSIGDAVIATDSNGQVTRMNAAAEKLTGWSLAEAAGQPMEEVFRIVNAHTRESMVGPVQQVLSSGKTTGRTNHTLLLARNGKEYQIADSAAPIQKQTGGIFGVVLVFSDVTEQYQAQEAVRLSERRLNFALQTSHTGAWDLDLRDHTTHRTLIHDQIFGYEGLLPTWTYEMFLEHVVPEDRSNVDRSFHKARATQTAWNVECRIRRADGAIRWILAAGDHERNTDGGYRAGYNRTQTGGGKAPPGATDGEHRHPGFWCCARPQ